MLKLSTVNDSARVCKRLSQAFVIIALSHYACLRALVAEQVHKSLHCRLLFQQQLSPCLMQAN